MPYSMTGFGAAEGPVAGGRLRVEIRTVNHRHFNLSPKLPADLSVLEPELRDNKSSFFRDLESELLKSDITDDLAEDSPKVGQRLSVMHTVLLDRRSAVALMPPAAPHTFPGAPPVLAAVAEVVAHLERPARTVGRDRLRCE